MANILFLEDEKMIREVLAEYMTVTGYSVTECESGDDAVELIDDEENNFDLAVLDIRVPGKIEPSVSRRPTAGRESYIFLLTIHSATPSLKIIEEIGRAHV